MGAWIEIPLLSSSYFQWEVAPHDGCVDWNWQSFCNIHKPYVAPHDGCVDWNLWALFWLDQVTNGRTPRWVRGLKYHTSQQAWSSCCVAPHDGCVDWNKPQSTDHLKQFLSHPTMGAWIEIEGFLETMQKRESRTPRWVRGLKFSFHHEKLRNTQSHPTMGAWIEIVHVTTSNIRPAVAPHDGCVDWNIHKVRNFYEPPCRTPRWVRGLKYFSCSSKNFSIKSHPTMGAWIEILISYRRDQIDIVAPHDGCVDWNTGIVADIWFF